MKKRFIIALLFLLLLSTYNIQDNFKFNSKFNVKNILIENNSIVTDKIIQDKLSFIFKRNLFLLTFHTRKHMNPWMRIQILKDLLEMVVLQMY